MNSYSVGLCTSSGEHVTENGHAQFQPPMEGLATHVLELTNIYLSHISAINQVSSELMRNAFYVAERTSSNP